MKKDSKGEQSNWNGRVKEWGMGVKGKKRGRKWKMGEGRNAIRRK